MKEEIKYLNPHTLLLINSQGNIRQLFVPFKVEVILATGLLKLGSTVIVEEVREHEECILIYRIGRHWWPFNTFKLIVKF